MKRGLCAAVVICATLSLSAKPLVWWTMQNDAANGGSNIVETTTFTNIASAANEFYGKIGPGSTSDKRFILPVPTNGFENPYMLQDGTCGVPAANDFAIDIPSDPDREFDHGYGCSLYPYDPEGKLNLQSFTIEFFFRTKKWTNWHCLLDKPFFGKGTNTLAVIEQSYSRTKTTLKLRYTYLDSVGVPTLVTDVSIYSGSSPCIQDGNWHHIALTLDQSSHNLKLYIDGSLKSTTTLPGDLLYSDDLTKWWHIGGSPDADWAWGGTIDEFRFHDRALSADELLRRTDQVPTATTWTAGTSGDWNVAGNWSDGVPVAGKATWITEDVDSPITVSVADSAASGDFAIRNMSSRSTLSVLAPLAFNGAAVSAFEGGAIDVGGAGSMSFTDSSFALNWGSSLSSASGSSIVFDGGTFTETAGTDMALTGAVAAVDSTFTLDGGTAEFAGTVAMTNCTFTSYNHVTIPAGASFSFTNDVANKLKFDNGSVLNLKGHLSISITNNTCPVTFKKGSSFIASGNASFMAQTDKQTATGIGRQGWFYFTGSNMEFRDNAVITNYHTYFNVEAAGMTNRIAFRDSSSMVMTGDGTLSVGNGSYDNALTVFDYASSKDIKFPYGVTVARGHNAEMNITGGSRMLGNGNPNSVGYACGNRAVTGVVNVVKGSWMRNASDQYAKWLYGTSVGDSMAVKIAATPKAFGRGTLNIYPEGVVTNSSGMAWGQGGYLRVGTGRGEGDINQLGGTLYHSSRFQAVLGLWGGIGRWTLMSNSTATVLSDVYVGGSLTNVLRGFIEGKNDGYHADFIATFDVNNHTSKGTLSVMSGTFFTPSNIYVSVDGEGALVLGQDKKAWMLARDVVLSNTVDSANSTTYRSTLRFVFGEDGCAQLVCGGKNAQGVPQPTGRLVVGEGSKLEIDLTELTDKKASWYPLVSCAEIVGSFADADVTVTQPESRKVGGKLVAAVRNGVNGYWWFVPRGSLMLFK